MNTIKFSHSYPKLWGQKKATLLLVKEIGAGEINRTQKEYDTYYSESWSGGWNYTSFITEKKGYCPLPEKGRMLLLLFLGEYNIPFTTIRPYNKLKHEYYGDKIKQEFEVKIGGK